MLLFNPNISILTRTGASGTATLTESFFGHSLWLHERQKKILIRSPHIPLKNQRQNNKLHTLLNYDSFNISFSIGILI